MLPSKKEHLLPKTLPLRQSQIIIGDSLSRPFIQVRIQKVQKYISGPVIFKGFFDIKQCLVLVPLAFTQNGVLVSPRDVKYDFLPQIVDNLSTICQF